MPKKEKSQLKHMKLPKELLTAVEKRQKTERGALESVGAHHLTGLVKRLLYRYATREVNAL